MAVGTLSIDLEARLGRLEEGMTRAARLAEKNASSISNAYSKVGNTFASLGKLVGGAFAAQQIVRFAANTVAGVDALNDFADAVGTSVENASALEDAAARTGTSMETVTAAAVKLNMALKDAKPDSGVAQALKAIGLNAEELRKIDPAEALLQVAKALSGFADDGNKARLIMELFGKSAKEVAPFLKDLAEQQQLVATITTEQAQAAEKLSHEWAALTKSAVDLARAIAGPLISGLNSLIDYGKRVKDLISSKGLIGGLQEDIANATRLRTIENNPALMAEINNPANYGNEGRRTAFRPSVADVAKLTGGGKSLKTAAAKAQEPTAVISESLQGLLDRIDASDEQKLAKLRATLEEMVKFSAGGGTLPDSVWSGIAEDLARLDPAAQSAAEAMKDLQRTADEGRAIFEATRTPAETLASEIDRLNKLLQAGAIDWDTYARAQFAAQDKFDETQDKVKKQADKVDDVARDLGLTFSSAFEDAIVDGAKFSDVLKGIEKDLLRIATRKLVTEPLANFATSAISSAGGVGGIFAQIASMFAGAFADGGFIPPGQWGVVGERGPELAFGGRSGKSIAPAGGVSVSNTFYLSGPVDMRAQQQIAAHAARSVEQASRRYN